MSQICDSNDLQSKKWQLIGTSQPVILYSPLCSLC